jgi:hypothetical protein
MQSLNNNMDELFRNAAAGYPLKTDNSDWDGLASRLLNPIAPPVSVRKKNKFKKYGPPLMLILIMLVLDGGPVKKQTRSYSTAFPTLSVKKNAPTDNTIVSLNPDAATIKQQQHLQLQVNNRTAILHATHHEPENGTATRSNNKPLTNIKSNGLQTSNARDDKNAGKHIMGVHAPDLTYNTEQLTDGNIVSAVTNLPFKEMREAQRSVDKRTDAIQRPSRIYWGFVFGPGINRVKKQKLQKPGFDIGIIAGFTLLKDKAAVEAGLLYTQKYYYSDGKYFDMDKGGNAMPAGMEVMSLEGSSTLFELPVKFRYKVLQKNSPAVFLSTGISSYLMTKEENDYLAMMNGSEQSMVGLYKENKRYVAVTANIGADFNFYIGKHTHLRIEPYLQIPLQGIGIGSMPVMTTGIHLGFMRSTP